MIRLETPSIVEVRPPAASPLGPQSSGGGPEVSGGAKLEGRLGHLVEKWSMEEIEDWSRVTVRLANHAANDAVEKGSCKQTCLDKRSEVIRQRWLSAEPHIPESLLSMTLAETKPLFIESIHP